MSVCLGLGVGVAANRHKGTFWGDENVLKLDGGDGCTGLQIY